MLYNPNTNNFYLNKSNFFDFNTIKWVPTSIIPEELTNYPVDALKELQMSDR